MKLKQTTSVAFSSLAAAAMVFSSLFIHIPIPGGFGFLNICDAFIIAFSFYFSPVYSAGAAIAGGALSDFLLGYSAYVPATVICKSIIALSVSLTARKKNTVIVSVSALVSGLIQSGLYFMYEFLILKYGAGAAVNIPYNIGQTVASLIIAVLIIKVINKTGLDKKIDRS